MVRTPAKTAVVPAITAARTNGAIEGSPVLGVDVLLEVELFVVEPLYVVPPEPPEPPP